MPQCLDEGSRKSRHGVGARAKSGRQEFWSPISNLVVLGSVSMAPDECFCCVT